VSVAIGDASQDALDQEQRVSDDLVLSFNDARSLGEGAGVAGRQSNKMVFFAKMAAKMKAKAKARRVFFAKMVAKMKAKAKARREKTRKVKEAKERNQKSEERNQKTAEKVKKAARERLLKNSDALGKYASIINKKLPHCKSLFRARGNIYGRLGRSLRDWLKLYMQGSTCQVRSTVRSTSSAKKAQELSTKTQRAANAAKSENIRGDSWLSNTNQALITRQLNSAVSLQGQVQSAFKEVEKYQGQIKDIKMMREEISKAVFKEGSVTWSCSILQTGSQVGFVCASRGKAKREANKEARSTIAAAAAATTAIAAATSTMKKASGGNAHSIRETGRLGESSRRRKWVKTTTICKALLFDQNQQPWSGMIHKLKVAPLKRLDEACTLMKRACKGAAGWEPFKDTTLVLSKFPIMKQVYCRGGNCTVAKDVTCSRNTTRVSALLFGEPFTNVNAKLDSKKEQGKRTKKSKMNLNNEQSLGEGAGVAGRQSNKLALKSNLQFLKAMLAKTKAILAKAKKARKKAMLAKKKKAAKAASCMENQRSEREKRDQAAREQPGCGKTRDIKSLIKHF